MTRSSKIFPGAGVGTTSVPGGVLLQKIFAQGSAFDYLKKFPGGLPGGDVGAWNLLIHNVNLQGILVIVMKTKTFTASAKQQKQLIVWNFLQNLFCVHRNFTELSNDSNYR